MAAHAAHGGTPASVPALPLIKRAPGSPHPADAFSSHSGASSVVGDREAVPDVGDALETPRISRTRQLTSHLNSAMDEMGPGPYQLIVLVFGGGVYTAEGSLLLMLSIISKNLIEKWNLSPIFAGAMAAVIFAGLLAGTIFGGLACDRYGRRGPILLTYLGICVFVCVGLVAPGFFVLIIAKFLLGFSLGFGLPACNAIVCESCPRAHRTSIYCMTMVLFSLGQLYSATIVWMMNPMLTSEDFVKWRTMLALATLLPFINLIVAYFFLLESPHWLLINGRLAEVQNVVKTLASYVDRKDFDYDVFEHKVDNWSWADADGRKSGVYVGDLVKLTPPSTPETRIRIPAEEGTPLVPREGQAEAYKDKTHRMCSKLCSDFVRVHFLFTPEYYLTTVIMLCVTFASNFAYYGMIYGLPDTVRRAGATEESVNSGESYSPAAAVFWSAAFEIPGVFAAIILGMTIGRRTNMSLAFMATSVSLAGVSWALHNHRIMETVGLLCVLGVKLSLATGYIIVYLYLLECYPTRFRGTGLAFCMVLGKFGAFCCPFLYDGLHILGFARVWFFVVMSGLLFFASIGCLFLPYETKDSELLCDMPPPQPTGRRAARRPSWWTRWWGASSRQQSEAPRRAGRTCACDFFTIGTPRQQETEDPLDPPKFALSA